MSKVDQYFKDYPNSKQCFESADGLLFHSEADAKNHGVVIKDTDVTPHKRPAEKAAAKAEVKTDDTATAKAKKAEETKAAKEKKAAEEKAAKEAAEKEKQQGTGATE